MTGVWGDVPTWVASIGTVLAVSIALYQTAQARTRENEERKAATAERAAATALAQREHAESIAAWYAGDVDQPTNDGVPMEAEPGVRVGLANASRHLAYNVVIFQVFIQGTGPRTGEQWMAFEKETSVELDDPHSGASTGCKVDFPNMWEGSYVVLGALQPTTSFIDMRPIDRPMQGRIGVELAFTDRGGRHWLRRSTGSLESLQIPAIRYYGIPEPINYRVAY